MEGVHHGVCSFEKDTLNQVGEVCGHSRTQNQMVLTFCFPTNYADKCLITIKIELSAYTLFSP